MDLLIIGGTRFLGRHLAQQALAAGHRVTLLHRGRSGPALFPEAEHLIADRDGDLAVLGPGGAAGQPRGRCWDAAIDTSAYFPRQVRTLATRLRGRVGQYQLVSTISVYATLDSGRRDEEAALVELAGPNVEQVTGDSYGGLKVLCERAAMQGFAGSGTAVLAVRPGLLVGPFDPTGRFTWWVQRITRGGATLVPAAERQPVQFIDARDAAAWMLRQAQHTPASSAGPFQAFNLTGPSEPLTFGAFLATAREALRPLADAAPVFEPVDEAFLRAQGVQPWTDLPLWLPADSHGLLGVDIARALAKGLACRPLRETLLDTARWAQQASPIATSLPTAPAGAVAQPEPPRPAVGLSPEREQQLLATWRARR